MPPTRRQLRALGSLQLVGYANNPTKVITELAFIADKQANAVAEGRQSEADTPLEVQFNEFMDGVNSRGKGTKTRQRKMTVEQAVAVLLVTVQRGHVELITKENDPHTIDAIRILPEAKRILATFLPKLRGYGDIPYDQQYRGAIALAKRHFFPKGKAPTKNELMALLLQSYQERRELIQRCQTQRQPAKTLGIQTSLESVNVLSTPRMLSRATSGVYPATFSNTAETPSQPGFQRRIDLSSNDIMGDVGSTSAAPEVGPDLDNEDSCDMISGPETEPAQLITCTPSVAPKSFNPYLTPVSNPRHAGHTSSLLDASPTSGVGNYIEVAPSEDDLTDDDVGEMLQATATSRGRLNYYYNKFKAACQRITFLEGQKEEIEKEFDLTKRKLDETEQYLRAANVDRWRLSKWVDTLLRRVDSIYGQLGLLRGMTGPEAIDSEGWSVYDPGFQGGFDPNSI